MSRTERDNAFKTGGDEFGGDRLDGAQSEQIGMQRFNTLQDFFKIEMENESLRDRLYEVQSNFTTNDRKYLEMSQQKYYAETEYEQYRVSA